MGLPIRCALGVDCWLLNLVDHDPGKGVRDFQCSDHLYDGHKGTDIAIRDLQAMRKGVPVLASAPGKVTALRDGMLDQNPSASFQRANKRFCGNGVIVKHNAEWETQYCHLKRKSIVVKLGQKVKRGQTLGMVGHSGMAMVPHIHLSVRYRGKVVDPFVGVNGKKACKIGEVPLWEVSALRALSHDMTAIYNVGFAPKLPNVQSIREGDYRNLAISRAVPALFLWAEIFWVQTNDKVRLRIIGPSGEIVIDHHKVLKKRQARRMVFLGRESRGQPWPVGRYQGEVLIERREGSDRINRYRAQSYIELKN